MKMNHWSTEPDLSSNSLGVSQLLELHHDWGCFCQAGDNGIVLSKKEPYSYRTAFFEAFPRNPKTFIRGEGKDIVEAEEDAWKQFSKFIACPGHEFERRSYTNGGALCKHCGLFMVVFEPTTLCVVCGKPTNHGTDKDENWYCEEHYRDMPLDKWPDWRRSLPYHENEMWDWEHNQPETPTLQ
jgi:hypothetical protein